MSRSTIAATGTRGRHASAPPANPASTKRARSPSPWAKCQAKRAKARQDPSRGEEALFHPLPPLPPPSTSRGRTPGTTPDNPIDLTSSSPPRPKRSSSSPSPDPSPAAKRPRLEGAPGSTSRDPIDLTGDNQEPFSSPRAQEAKRSCVACLDALALSLFPAPPSGCRHESRICGPCLKTALAVAVEGAGPRMVVRCPAPECPGELRREDLERLAEPDVLERYDELHRLRVDNLASQAPPPLIPEDGEQLRALVAAESKPCPGGCGFDIEKNGGCSHMRCPVCHHHFCYDCLRPHLHPDCPHQAFNQPPPRHPPVDPLEAQAAVYRHRVEYTRMLRHAEQTMERLEAEVAEQWSQADEDGDAVFDVDERVADLMEEECGAGVRCPEDVMWLWGAAGAFLRPVD